MNKKGAVVIAIGVILLATGVFTFVSYVRSVQREWPGRQLENAAALGKAINNYHNTHNEYPYQLSDLVNRGSITTEQFENLQFRATPHAQPEEWVYHRPESLEDIAIVSPVMIYPWKGHSGLRVTASANGSGELVSAAKDYRMPQHKTK